MSALGIFQVLAGTVDAALGEPVTVYPMIGGRISAAVPDTTRPQRTIIGIFADDPNVTDVFHGRTHGHQALGTAQALMPGAILTITATQSALLGYSLAKNDVVSLDNRSEAYSISSPPEIDDLGATKLILSVWKGDL